MHDGVVSFLSAEAMTDQDERERSMRDAESDWYDAMFEGYTDAVEIPTAVRRVGQPTGSVLDAGCGTGRITHALLALGQPILALDYSEACLRHMLERTAGGRVLAVQADLRSLPIRSAAMAAITCIETYAQFREPDRRRILGELSRVLAPGGLLSISAFNYNLLFKLWRLLGNEGARHGEHMLGGDYYYFRFRREEFRRELEVYFEVDELAGIRNIPARTVASVLRRAGLSGAGDRFLGYM
ncbi:MAG: class I SAM-dependent methyltransferase, partial [Thermoleophilaceae bacterium]